ncbi:transcriptional regulator [Komagataeibacter nataicola]|uniref:Transcriptional regulator n=1 Tax=Komagataeibacter nataicola TaxID=265960 RepID=A0A9N7CAI3_9PROT|nr:transcriptional regulator [Komagataeibacter nataicola]PYD65123.1 transcriptional regulator [Komagataeibacter nataicola]
MRKPLSEKWLPCRQDWLRLYRRVRSLTRRDDAEDHLQSAFVNYLERPDGSIGHPEAYITRSAVNLSHNARRREQVGCIAPGGWDDMLGDVRDTAPTQEEAYQARERLLRFHAGCQRLPRRTRQAFVLHRVEKMTYREIAALMDISESSVEKRIAKALVFLSTWMEQ